MYDLAGEHGLDLEGLRTRLQRMSDRLRFGRLARYMCTPEASLGKKPRRVFVIQLREAVEEWRRRQPVESR
jgi:hypothetical protein